MLQVACYSLQTFFFRLTYIEACSERTSPELTPSQSTVSVDSGIVGHQGCAVVSIIAVSSSCGDDDTASVPDSSPSDATATGGAVVVAGAAVVAGDDVGGVGVGAGAAIAAVKSPSSSSNPWMQQEPAINRGVRLQEHEAELQVEEAK